MSKIGKILRAKIMIHLRNSKTSNNIDDFEIENYQTHNAQIFFTDQNKVRGSLIRLPGKERRECEIHAAHKANLNLCKRILKEF